MTSHTIHYRRTLYAAGIASLLVAAAIASGCGDSGAAGAAPGGPGSGGPPMAMPVEAVTLTAKPVEQSSEYIATVKSRRSTTIQPQVEGFITSITARPGRRVAAGAPLMQIDAGRQQAAVANLESVHAARQAELQWAQQQAERNKKLLDAGAISQQEYEQTQTAVRTTEAQLRSVEAQIREQRVELAYHTVTAPTTGVVGDIPVRIGDRVTTQTVLTTIDENAGLELYVNVPVAQATSLKPGLPVRIMDDAGKPIAASELNFISPSVDAATQSVLVKAPIASNAPFRIDQFVRTHVIWSNAPALTVPLVAVTRINGQYFVFVAEKGQDGMTVARQRAVQFGPVVGNDYVVLSGLKEGEQLIVSGIQKIGDGMPVTTAPPGTAAQTPPAAKGEGH
jgi:RND family efflux transporter MFP subunit